MGLKKKNYPNFENLDLHNSNQNIETTLKKYRALHSASEIKYRNLYEDSPVLLRTIDRDGIILDCNKLYAQRLGYTKEEIIGTSIFSYTPKDHYDSMKKTFQEWRNMGIVQNREIWLLTKDGKTFPCLLTAKNLYDENKNFIGSNTIIKDLSEIRDAQKSIDDLRSTRLKVVGELSARVAHDLRNPLNVISTALELLKKRYGKELPEESLLIFDMIDRATSRMVHQIEEVLEFVKTKPLKLEHVMIGQLIKEVLGREEIPLGIEIRLPSENVETRCDREKLEIVLINLIDNSLDAIKNQGIIEIKLHEDDREVVITIEDSGPGIPDEVLPNIFEPLITSKQTGTGLGLVSCKNIIEQHGGSIQAKNNPTIFTIKLPKIPLQESPQSMNLK